MEWESQVSRFDPKVVTTEKGTDMKGDWKVQITLSPALIQVIDPQTSMDYAKEVTIFLAMVVLR